MLGIEVILFAAFGYTNANHVARYNGLGSSLVVDTCYFNKNLLTCFGLMDDIHWLFAQESLDQFCTTRDDTYLDLMLNILSTLDLKGRHGPG